MFQTPIDRYLIFSHRTRPPPRTSPGILDLPYQVRKKIYLLLGIVRPYPISLNTPPAEGDCGDDIRDHAVKYRRDIDSWGHPPLPTQLFLTCRDLSQEVRSLLYSENEFFIARTAPGGLSGLEKMCLSSISRLRNLRIVLNDDFLCERMTCRFAHLPPPRDPGDALLRGSFMQTRNYEILMAQWKRICHRLGRSISELRLRLSVICDVDNYDLAAAIIQPLKALPTLAEFSIRIYPEFEVQYHTKLYPLVRELPAALTSHPRSPVHGGKLSWIQMPWEIRERILELTELVAPYDLAWIPTLGFKFDHYRYNPNHCWICDSVRKRCSGPLERKGVFSFQCSCWKFPLSLFLTSRQMHEDATRIFYSANHFKVVSYSTYREYIYGYHSLDGNRLDPVPFLNSVPDTALKYIRSLQFVMLDVPRRFQNSDEDGYKQWDQTMSRLHCLGNVSRLSLTLDLSESRMFSYNGHDEPVTQTTKDAEWKHYKRLVQPIIPLAADGLKSFFLHSAWPMYMSDYRPHRDRWERKFERLVMGKGYESKGRGKYAVSGRWYDERDPNNDVIY